MNMFVRGSRITRRIAVLVALFGMQPLHNTAEANGQQQVISHLPHLIAENVVNKSIVGRWVGQVTTKSGAIVSVSINASKNGIVVSYGGNRSCTLNGKYEGMMGNKVIYSMLSQNGGVFCDKIAQVHLTQHSSTLISYEAVSHDKSFRESCTLSQQNGKG